MVMYCPYCDIEINEAQLEAEDGCCPECGALITVNTVITQDEDDEYDDEFDDDFIRRDDYEDYDDGMDEFDDDDY